MESRLLGQRIVIGKREELFSVAEDAFCRGGKISTVNPLILEEAERNTRLRRALNKSINIPDGVGVAKALLKRGIFTDVYPGIELGVDLLSLNKPTRLALIGGKEGVANRAFFNLSRKYKNLTLAFLSDGYTYKEEDLIKKICETKPNLAFVCLGAPRQEILIDRLYSHYKSCLYIGLGGSLDVYSGDKKRAPRFIRKISLEWLWRMIKEPSRIGNIRRMARFYVKCGKEAKNSL